MRNRIIVLGIAVVLGACSKERVGSREIMDIEVPWGSQEDTETQDTTQTEAVCPLEFPEAGLCAKVKWTGFLLEETKSEFTVVFWEQGKGSETGPFVDPVILPTTVFEMKCCHTPTAFALVRQAQGVYRAEVSGLPAGEYFHHIRLGNKANSEAVTSDVVVE